MSLRALRRHKEGRPDESTRYRSPGPDGGRSCSQGRSSAIATPWPTPTHIADSDRRPPASASCSAAVPVIRAPDMPSGWPSAMAPPLGLTRGSSSATPSARRSRQNLAGEGLVQFDHVEIVDAEAEADHQLLGGRRRPDPHDPRRDPRRRAAEIARNRGEPVLRRRLGGGEDQRRGAIVDAGGISRRHASAVAERRRQPGERVDRRGARMFVARHNRRVAFALGDRHRRDLLRQPTVVLRPRRLGLRTEGEGVLIGPADRELLGDVLGRLGHRIDAVLGFHRRVDEAPADRRVVDLGVARKGALGLGHDEWRARHAFDAAGDHQLGLASPDRPRRSDDGVHAGAAQPVDRRSANADRQPGQQQRHAGDVAIVFARLVGAAKDDVVDRLPVDAGVSAHQGLEGSGREIVGAHRRQGAAEPADRRANVVADEDFAHFTHPGRRGRRPALQSTATALVWR